MYLNLKGLKGLVMTQPFNVENSSFSGNWLKTSINLSYFVFQI